MGSPNHHPKPCGPSRAFLGPRATLALDVLLDLLSEGPRPAAEIVALTNNQGIAQGTLRCAKRHANILSIRGNQPGPHGNGSWLWALPAPTAPGALPIEDDNQSAPRRKTTSENTPPH